MENITVSDFAIASLEYTKALATLFFAFLIPVALILAS
jgi:hypothetical protein